MSHERKGRSKARRQGQRRETGNAESLTFSHRERLMLEELAAGAILADLENGATDSPIQRRARTDSDIISQPEMSSRGNVVLNYHGPFTNSLQLTTAANEFYENYARMNGKIVITELTRDRAQEHREVQSIVSGKLKQLIQGTALGGRVNPSPDSIVTPRADGGWTIAVNGEKIAKSLRELPKATREDAFVKQFNAITKQGLMRALVREKLTGGHNSTFNTELFITLFPPVFMQGMVELGLAKNTLTSLPDAMFVVFAFLAVIFLGVNLPLNLFRNFGGLGEGRSLRNYYDFLMPQIEIDRVMEGVRFLRSREGKTIIAKKPEESLRS